VKQPYLVLCDSKTREQIFGDYSVRLNLTKINKNQYQATFVQRRGYVGYINARLVKNYVVKINFVFENNKWKLSNLTRTQANLNLTKEEAARAIIDDDIGNRNVKYLKTIKKTSSHLVFYFTGSSFGQKTIFKVDNLTGEVSD
jgi:hypothetical protein